MKPEAITSDNFRAFGRVIHYPNKSSKGTTRNLWRIVHTEPARVGWRVAYLVLRDKTLGRLEMHPASDETFEPVKGRALFFVSKRCDFKDIKCFKLDKPIVLRKGVWHGLITIDSEAEIKVTENAKVTCKYWKFPRRIKSIKDVELLSEQR
ncbi:MAG: ureidoglycolate hydrolase [Lysobacterales bacterium]|jgi:ureidoglycolate hydrolase